MTESSASLIDSPGDGLTVVMVEDHPEILETGAEMLRDVGFAVAGFETADAAFQALQDGCRCDLLFTDIVLPGDMDGLALVREVQALRPGLATLLTTGWADRTRELEPNLRLIGKPYRQTDLVRKVCDLLGVV